MHKTSEGSESESYPTLKSQLLYVKAIQPTNKMELAIQAASIISLLVCCTPFLSVLRRIRLSRSLRLMLLFPIYFHYTTQKKTNQFKATIR